MALEHAAGAQKIVASGNGQLGQHEKQLAIAMRCGNPHVGGVDDRLQVLRQTLWIKSADDDAGQFAAGVVDPARQADRPAAQRGGVGRAEVERGEIIAALW